MSHCSFNIQTRGAMSAAAAEMTHSQQEEMTLHQQSETASFSLYGMMTSEM